MQFLVRNRVIETNTPGRGKRCGLASFDNERSELGRPFQAADSVSTECTGQKAGAQGRSPAPLAETLYLVSD